MDLQSLIANLAGPVRRTTLNGREHLVAPLRMIVPGVLAGSKGPLYYPPEEIARDYTAWNHMPIVVYHPTKDGHAISARDPDVLNKQCIGTVLNARINNGMLDADGYFDIARTRHIRAEILTKLESGKPIELSTGLFTDNQPAHNGATHKGKQYTYIARNYRPDHLAILPDKVGACSIKDGCGVLVNEEEERTHTATDFAKVSVGLTGVALGAERSKLIPGATKRLHKEFGDAKLTIVDHRPANFEFKPFDIVLTSSPNELKDAVSGKSKFQKLVNISTGVRERHAELVVPDKNGVLRLVSVGGEGTTIDPVYKKSLAAAKALGVSGEGVTLKPSSPRGLLGTYDKKLGQLTKIGERAGKAAVLSVADVHDSIGGNVTAANLFRDRGSFRVMRSAKPLTEVEHVKLMKNLVSVYGKKMLEEDQAFSAISNFIKGPGKAAKAATGGISSCSGGICRVFEGVRDLGDAAKTLPIDLRGNPALKEAGNFITSGQLGRNMPSRAVISSVAKRAALMGLGAKVAIAAIPIAIGSYFLTKGLAGSPKTSGGNCGTGSGGFQEGNTCAHNDYVELAANWGNEEEPTDNSWGDAARLASMLVRKARSHAGLAGRVVAGGVIGGTIGATSGAIMGGESAVATQQKKTQKQLTEYFKSEGVDSRKWIEENTKDVTHIGSSKDVKRGEHGFFTYHILAATADTIAKEKNNAAAYFTKEGKAYILAAPETPVAVLAHEYGHIQDQRENGKIKGWEGGVIGVIKGKELGREEAAWKYSGYDPIPGTLDSYRANKKGHQVGAIGGGIAGAALGVSMGLGYHKLAIQEKAIKAKYLADELARMNRLGMNDYAELADNWGLADNCLKGLSYEQLKVKIQDLLDQVDLPLLTSDEDFPTLTVVDIYDDHVLYTDGSDGYVQEYTNEDGNVMLVGEPEPVLDEGEDDEGIAVDQNVDTEPSVNANPNHDELGRFAEATSDFALETGSRARYAEEHLEASHTHSNAARAHADAAEVAQDEQHIHHRAKVHKHARLAKSHHTASEIARKRGDRVQRVGPILGGLVGGYIGSKVGGASETVEGVNTGVKVGGTVSGAISKIVARKKVRQHLNNELTDAELLLLNDLLEGDDTTTEVTPEYSVENMGGKFKHVPKSVGSGPIAEGSTRWHIKMSKSPEEEEHYQNILAEETAQKEAGTYEGGGRRNALLKSLGFGPAATKAQDNTPQHEKLAIAADYASAKANASGSVLEHAQAAALHTHASLSKTGASIAAARAARHHAKSVVHHTKAAKNQATSWFTGQAYGAGTEENPNASGTSPVDWPGKDKGGMPSEDPEHPMGAWTSATKWVPGEHAGPEGWSSSVPGYMKKSVATGAKPDLRHTADLARKYGAGSEGSDSATSARGGDNCGTGAGGFKAGNTCATNEEGEEVNSYNEGVEEMALNAETRGKMVKKLVTNCKCSGRKDCPDEAALNEESDASLLELTVNAFCEGDDEGDAEDTAEAGKEEPMDKKKGMPFGKKPMMNEQEWLATAPPSIRSVVQNAMDFEKKQKDTLVAQITANASNVFTKEHLATFDIQQLQGIAALATNTKVKQAKVEEKAPLYLGAAGGPIASTVTNEGFDKEDLDMIPPTINYAEEAKARRQLAGVN